MIKIKKKIFFLTLFFTLVLGTFAFGATMSDADVISQIVGTSTSGSAYHSSIVITNATPGATYTINLAKPTSIYNLYIKASTPIYVNNTIKLDNVNGQDNVINTTVNSISFVADSTGAINVTSLSAFTSGRADIAFSYSGGTASTPTPTQPTTPTVPTPTLPPVPSSTPPPAQTGDFLTDIVNAIKNMWDNVLKYGVYIILVCIGIGIIFIGAIFLWRKLRSWMSKV